jgi:hypothetical protein
VFRELGPETPIRRSDVPAHDPTVLADLAHAMEPVLLVQLDRHLEQESTVRNAPSRHLRERLDETSSG